MDKLLTIGKLSKISGVSTRSIRHYEELGLIKASRNAYSNYRLYNEAEVKKLAQVVLLKDLGISLDNINTILNSSDNDKTLNLLENGLDGVKNKISQLQEQKILLESLINLSKVNGFKYFTDFKIIKELKNMNLTFINIFNKLDSDLQIKIIKDLYIYGEITNDTLILMDKTISKELTDSLKTYLVTSIIKNTTEENQLEIMNKLKLDENDIFEEINSSMFTLDDIEKLDDYSMQKWLRKVEYEDLIYSMLGMNETTIKKIFSNLSKTLAEKAKISLNENKEVTRDKIYTAATKVLDAFKDLYLSGEIKIK